VLGQFPRLIPEIGGLVFHSAKQALAGSSAIGSMIDAAKVRRVVPDAAVGAGWHPPHEFVRALEPFLTPEAEVLELACGSGRISHLVAPRVRTLVATDMSATMVREAVKNLAPQANVLVQITNGRTLEEFGDNTFDLVFAAGMFGYVESTFFLALLDEMQRVLRPGGVVVFNEMLVDDDQEAEYLLTMARKAARRGHISGTVERPLTVAQIEKWGRLVGLELVSAEPGEPDGSGLRRRIVVARATDAS
jgi:SAM-dependent methyltransferase